MLRNFVKYGSLQYDAGRAVLTATLLPRTRAARTNSWTTAGLAVVMVPSMSKASAEGFGFNKGSGWLIVGSQTRRNLHGQGWRCSSSGRWLRVAITDAQLAERCTVGAMRRTIYVQG